MQMKPFGGLQTATLQIQLIMLNIVKREWRSRSDERFHATAAINQICRQRLKATELRVLQIAFFVFVSLFFLFSFSRRWPPTKDSGSQKGLSQHAPRSN